MRRLLPLAAATCALVLFSSLSLPMVYAQTSPPSAPGKATLTVEASLVTLPVTVRDKNGKTVTGLTKDDFTLSEDDRPETIKYFSVDTDLPLTLGLVVDTSMSLRDSLEQERSASKGFLDAMITRPTDKGFLLHFDSEVELLQDLTPSKDKLERALGELGPTRSTGDGSSGDSGSDDHSHHSMHDGGTTLYDAIFLGSDDLMRKQTGRKALIVVSDGVDRGSKETLASAMEAAQRAETVVYAIYLKGEEHDHGGDSGPGNRGGGGRHGGGGMGGGWPGGSGGGWPGSGGGASGGGGHPPEEPHVDGKKIMAQIAGETGGRFFEAKKKESLDEIYGAIRDELRTEYTLAYTPDPASASTGFHKIALSVKKKGLEVQTRPGYYADR